MARRDASPWTQIVLWLSIIGALNWGLVGFFNWDLVRAIFGNDSATPASGISRVIYALVGLSGLGDLILTCSTPQSRNFALGQALGRGEAAPSGKLAEGAFTAPVLVELAAAEGVDMPVSNAVADILRGAVTIDDAVQGLLMRPFKAEG